MGWPTQNEDRLAFGREILRSAPEKEYYLRTPGTQIVFVIPQEDLSDDQRNWLYTVYEKANTRNRVRVENGDRYFGLVIDTMFPNPNTTERLKTYLKRIAHGTNPFSKEDRR